MSVYYLYLNDKTEGPFTRDEVDRMLEAGKISPATLYCQPGGQWNPVATMAPKKPASVPAATAKSAPAASTVNPPPTSALDQLRKNTNYPQAREWVIFLVTVAKGLNLLWLIGAILAFIRTIIGLIMNYSFPMEWYYILSSAIIFFCFWLVGLRLVKAMDQFLQMGIDAVDALVHMAGNPQLWKTHTDA